MPRLGIFMTGNWQPIQATERGSTLVIYDSGIDITLISWAICGLPTRIRIQRYFGVDLGWIGED